jgi:hypothetical protein
MTGTSDRNAEFQAAMDSYFRDYRAARRAREARARRRQAAPGAAAPSFLRLWLSVLMPSLVRWSL